MAEITKDLAEKALNVEAANILKKLKDGKTLNNSERAIMAAIADGQKPGGASAWAKTKVDLANALGVARMTLDRWIKLKRNPPPKPESDGRWNVLEWKNWMKESGRGGGVDGDSLEDDLPRLNAKRLLLINERLELDNAERRGELISREEVVKEAAEIATGMRSAFYGQAGSLCAEVMKQTEIDSAVRLYNEVIDRVLADLVAGLKVARKRTPAAIVERDSEEEPTDGPAV